MAVTAKEYLSQVRIILKRLENLNNTLEEIRGLSLIHI